jgi:hypothetical protein
MRLRRAVFRGVRGVPDGSFDFTDPRTGEPHSLVFVTGPSASGKTRFLEAIIAAKELIAPYGARPSPAPWVRPGDTAAKVTLTWQLSEEERVYGALDSASVETDSIFTTFGPTAPEDDGITSVLRRYEHGHATGKIEYFPAHRSVPTNGVGIGLTPFEQRTLRPTADARKYASVMRVVHELAPGGPTADYFAGLLERLSPTCRFEATPSHDGFPKCFTGGGERRSIRELSSSELDAVIFAATAVLLGLSNSLVFIDTPELYADPAYLPALAEGLVSLGEGVQVIAATRSPELLRGAKPGQVQTLGKGAAA